MKTIFLTVALLISSSVFAEKIQVMDIKSTWIDNSVEKIFVVDKDLGRAWVEVIVRKINDADEVWTEYFEESVEGLRFDEATSSIVLDRDGRLVECAKVKTKGRWVFTHDVIVPTNCSLEHEKYTASVDNGRRITKQKRIKIELNIKE